MSNGQQEIVKSSDDESYYVKQDSEGKDQGKADNEEEAVSANAKGYRGYI